MVVGTFTDNSQVQEPETLGFTCISLSHIPFLTHQLFPLLVTLQPLQHK